MNYFDTSIFFILGGFFVPMIMSTNVDHFDSVREGNKDMETRRMDRNSKGFFEERSVVLKSQAMVIPNLDSSICTACNNQWFSDTDIHIVNLMGK